MSSSFVIDRDWDNWCKESNTVYCHLRVPVGLQKAGSRYKSPALFRCTMLLGGNGSRCAVWLNLSHVSQSFTSTGQTLNINSLPTITRPVFKLNWMWGCAGVRPFITYVCVSHFSIWCSIRSFQTPVLLTLYAIWYFNHKCAGLCRRVGSGTLKNYTVSLPVCLWSSLWHVYLRCYTQRKSDRLNVSLIGDARFKTLPFITANILCYCWQHRNKNVCYQSNFRWAQLKPDLRFNKDVLMQ